MTVSQLLTELTRLCDERVIKPTDIVMVGVSARTYYSNCEDLAKVVEVSRIECSEWVYLV